MYFQRLDDSIFSPLWLADDQCLVRKVRTYLPVLIPPGFIFAVHRGNVRFATRPRLTKTILRDEVGIYRTGAIETAINGVDFSAEN